MTATLFEKIIKREIPADIIYEDDISIVIKDINPQAPTHLLIIPKKVIPKLSDANQEDQEAQPELQHPGDHPQSARRRYHGCEISRPAHAVDGLVAGRGKSLLRSRFCEPCLGALF